MPFYDKLRYGIKLLLSKDKGFYSFLYGLTGFCPRDVEIYKTALRHSSLNRRNGEVKIVNNERLEYLGDALLNAIVSDVVYHANPAADEGRLTRLRSQMVCRATLNELADKLGLTSHLRHSVTLQSHNCSMGGNALEAFIGAVYLDRGYSDCRKFICRRVLPEYDALKSRTMVTKDYKSLLIEWSQKRHVKIEYVLEQTTYDNHKNPIFHTAVFVNDERMGFGVGYSKRESQQLASKNAATKMSLAM